MPPSKSMVKFIDDDPEDRMLYKSKLESAAPLRIIPVDPQDYSSLEQCSEILADRPKAVLIDKKLDEFFGTAYDGFSLAGHIRAIDHMMPIYILTNFEEESDEVESGWSVECIIPKENFKRRKDYEVYAKRITRAIGRYEEALLSREAELSALIDKKVSGKLSRSESLKLNRIRLEIGRPHSLRESDELQRMQDMDSRLQQIDRTLKEVEKRLRK